MAELLDVQGVEWQAVLAAADFEGARVLEVGCGDGRLTFRYARLPVLAVGLEPSAKQLASAQEARPPGLERRLSFVRASALALPFRPAAFDLALLARTL